MEPMQKRFARDAATFQALAIGFGSCFATDRITVDGARVGYMYRDPPDDSIDSGWRFFAGDESDEYANNPDNFAIYDVNTIANYDPAITPHLDAPVGAALVRDGEAFIRDAGRRSAQGRTRS